MIQNVEIEFEMFFLTSQKQHLDIIFTFFTWVPARPPPRHRCPKHFDRWDPDTMPTGHGMSRQRKTYRVSRKTQSPTTKPKNSEQHRKTESIGSNQHRQSLCLVSVYHLKTHALAGRSFRTRLLQDASTLHWFTLYTCSCYRVDSVLPIKQSTTSPFRLAQKHEDHSDCAPKRSALKVLKRQKDQKGEGRKHV